MDAPPNLTLQDWARHALSTAELSPAAHHDLLMQRLTELDVGTLDRLLVLMPPGSAKSTYVSILFIAWWLHRHPRSAVILACHTADLAEHFGRQLRNVISENAEVLGYGLTRDQRAAGRWTTGAGGQFFATGIRGPITGRRADLVVIDDPVKSHMEADSASQREHVWQWYRGDLVTRLRPGARVVTVMTRWHEDDLGGRLLASGDHWNQLRLPALAEADDPLGRPPGAPLWPEWEDLPALERKRQMVGSRVWSALYQQRPRPDSGGLFAVKRIDIIDEVPADLKTIRAWDLAATAAAEGGDPDWTVGLRIGRQESGRHIVTDVVRFRAGPLETVETLIKTAALDGPDVQIGLPQDPGQAGKQQAAWLVGRLAGYRVTATRETGTKWSRALPVASQVDIGNLALVRAPWNRALLEEIGEFPQGRKDDQVDALSRAFSMLNTEAMPARRIHVPILGR